jgi:hypothetical protein
MRENERTDIPIPARTVSAVRNGQLDKIPPVCFGKSLPVRSVSWPIPPVFCFLPSFYIQNVTPPLRKSQRKKKKKYRQECFAQKPLSLPITEIASKHHG